MSYDSKCYELAKHFLEDKPDLRSMAGSLAQHIQTEIETWLSYEEDLRKHAGEYLSQAFNKTCGSLDKKPLAIKRP